MESPWSHNQDAPRPPEDGCTSYYGSGRCFSSYRHKSGLSHGGREVIHS